MADEYEFWEFADMAVEELRSFIDTEEQLVKEEHKLIDKLYSWDYVFQHLDEMLAEDSGLHKLNYSLIEKLTDIREIIESGEIHDLAILQEEKSLLQHLEKDIEHRQWKAIKLDISEEETLEKKEIRLQKHELKQLHSMFIGIMRLIKSKLTPALKHLAVPNEKQKFKRAEEYYLLQIYKFARAYERIFRHLWRKERILLRKLKKIA